MTNNLSRNLKFSIAKKSSLLNILNFCLISKDWYQICNNDSLLMSKIPDRYLELTVETKPEYKNIGAWYLTLYFHAVFPIQPSFLAKAAAKLNNVKLMDYAFNHAPYIVDFDAVMDVAIKYNSDDVVQRLLERDIEKPRGIYYFISKNYDDRLTELVPNLYSDNALLNEVCDIAARYGDLDVVDKLIQKGAIPSINLVIGRNQYDMFIHIFNHIECDKESVLDYVIRYNRYNMMVYLVEHGVIITEDHIKTAAMYGDYKNIKYLVDNGGSTCRLDTIETLKQRGYLDLADILLVKYHNSKCQN